jgi:large subunit ribosomal protein L9e
MKYLKSTKVITIPEGVTVTIKARQITVKGPKGTLSRDLRHQAVEFDVAGNKVTVSKWLGTKTELAVLQTYATHLENMIIGVTRGVSYIIFKQDDYSLKSEILTRIYIYI